MYRPLCIVPCAYSKYFDFFADFRQQNDKVLEPKENVVIETNERMNEVSSTLSIDKCTPTDEGNITVTAESKTGTATHVAKLTVVGV